MSVTFSGPAAVVAQGAASTESVRGQMGHHGAAAALSMPQSGLFSEWMEAASPETEHVSADTLEEAVQGDALPLTAEPPFAQVLQVAGHAMSAWPGAASVWQQSQTNAGPSMAVDDSVQTLTADMLSPAGAQASGTMDRMPSALVGLAPLKTTAQSLDVLGEAVDPTTLVVVRAAQPERAAVLPQVSGATAPAAVPTQQGPQALLEALGQRIQLQQVQGAEVATVRLDPPQMGSLEIRIRQEGAGVQVHIQASHAEVGRQLGMLVDSLRQELQQRSSEASVTVAQGRAMTGNGQGEQSRREHGQQPQDSEIGLALQAWGNQPLT